MLASAVLSATLVPLYTPAGHPFTPEHASYQTQLERHGSAKGVQPGIGGTASNEPYFRSHPVKDGFFRQFVLPCTAITQQMPPEGDFCDHSPKFSCGPVNALSHRPGCQVWSIGSKGQFCFEHFVSVHAPKCTIHTFDPTIPSTSLLHAAPYITMHTLGLSHVASERLQPVRGLRRLGKVRPLMALLNLTNVTWVHYLKVDCEGCEFDAIPQFLEEANSSLGYVPVTQLQLEIHVGYNETRGNRRAATMLASLEAHGFLPYHIDFAPPERRSFGTEYSFFNTRAPHRYIPKSESRVTSKSLQVAPGICFGQGAFCHRAKSGKLVRIEGVAIKG